MRLNLEQELEINARVEGDHILILQVETENLDASNVHTFRSNVHLLIQKRSHVVFDMSGIKFVDSSGLGALISCQRILKAANGDFRLCSMSVPVRALFDLMRMQRIFQIHENASDAVQSLSRLHELT